MSCPGPENHRARISELQGYKEEGREGSEAVISVSQVRFTPAGQRRLEHAEKPVARASAGIFGYEI